jgi:hypothetical protein
MDMPGSTYRVDVATRDVGSHVDDHCQSQAIDKGAAQLQVQVQQETKSEGETSWTVPEAGLVGDKKQRWYIQYCGAADKLVWGRGNRMLQPGGMHLCTATRAHARHDAYPRSGSVTVEPRKVKMSVPARWS